MSSTVTASTSKFAFRYGNPALGIGAAELRLQCRQLAVVATLSGTVHVADYPQLITLVVRSMVPEKAFVLDICALAHVADDGAALFDALDTACAAAGVDCSVVVGQEFSARAQLAEDLGMPVADSVADALNQFCDAMGQRRRLLPLLGKTA